MVMIGERLTIVYPHEENCEFHRHQGKIWEKCGDESGKDSSSETAYGKNGNLLINMVYPYHWKICDGDILPLDGYKST